MPPRLSPECQDLLSKMITVDHKERISAQDAIEHDWFKILNDKNLIKSMSMHDQQELDKEVL